jgi:hypothetical protein
MMQRSIAATGLLVSALALSALGLPSTGRAEDTMTAGEFLAECDQLNPTCRSEFVAGLQAVYEGHFACPPRIDSQYADLSLACVYAQPSEKRSWPR